MQFSSFTISTTLFSLATAAALAEPLKFYNDDKSIIYYTTMEMGGMTMGMDMTTVVSDDFTSTLNDGRTIAGATTATTVSSSSSSAVASASTSSSMDMAMDMHSHTTEDAATTSTSTQETSIESEAASSSTIAAVSTSSEESSATDILVQSGAGNKNQVGTFLTGLSVIALMYF